MTVLVNLWSGPRNVSTALMYAFRSRADTTVVDEPLYAAWLARNPGADHPGRELTMAAQSADADEVVAWLTGDDWPTPFVFAKQMASHLDGIDRTWLADARNLLLVRDPEPVVASYTEQVSAPTPEMLGYVVQDQLVAESLSRGEQPLVLETTRLLADPEGVLRTACDRLGMPWDPAMLSWEAGPKPEDGPWAPWWYERARASTGFGQPRPARPYDLPAAHAAVVDAARPRFERVAVHAI